jgi:hypothetical protein
MVDKLSLLPFSVGDILSKYRSGKLPKAFKIIPSLQNWEEVIMVAIIKFQILKFNACKVI